MFNWLLRRRQTRRFRQHLLEVGLDSIDKSLAKIPKKDPRREAAETEAEQARAKFTEAARKKF